MKTLALSLPPARLVCFGWTGRDAHERDAHIAELAALGVPPPTQTPILVELSPELATHSPEITVTGTHTSAEVEFVLVVGNDEVLVAVGSDHTDRVVERHSIPVSKQACAKCVSSRCWRFSEVEGHWDRLVLRSWVHGERGRIAYQEASAAAILPPRVLLEMAPRPGAGANMIFGGTIPTIAGIVHGDAFDLELLDPVLGRSLTHSYRVRVLPQRL